MKDKVGYSREMKNMINLQIIKGYLYQWKTYPTPGHCEGSKAQVTSGHHLACMTAKRRVKNGMKCLLVGKELGKGV